MMRKNSVQKEVSLRKAMAESIVSIRERIKSIEALSKRCFEFAREAKQLGKEDYALEMLKVCADLELFASELRLLAVEMESGTAISDCLKRMEKLPRVLAQCKKILSELPSPGGKVIYADAVAKCLDKTRAKLNRLQGKPKGGDVPSVLEEGFGRRGKMVAPAYHAILEEKKKALNGDAASGCEPTDDGMITLNPVSVQGLTDDGEE